MKNADQKTTAITLTYEDLSLIRYALSYQYSDYLHQSERWTKNTPYRLRLEAISSTYLRIIHQIESQMGR